MHPQSKKVLKFLQTIDQFKLIKRMVIIADRKREENDAEHAWHMAMMVWLLADFLETKIDLLKALKMCLCHDLVEIYAGDVFAFDHQKRVGKDARERTAAKKLFKQLPEQQSKELLELTEEYMDGKTKEAKFVKAIDKLQPVLENITSKGASWKRYKVTEQMVRDHKSQYVAHSPFLTEVLEQLLKDIRKL